jgi:hypothetical protein
MPSDDCVDECYDLVDPETKAPLELQDGIIGEAIHTALEYEAAPAFRNSGSIRTVPVNQSSGPLPEGCVPARFISMAILLSF